MIDSALKAAFLVELSKIAALTDKDKDLFKDIRQKANKFDRMAGAGMSTAQQRLHVDNTARMGELLKKKRGDIRTLPGWVRDPSASAPRSAGGAPGGAPRGSHWRAYDPWGGRPPPSAEDFRQTYRRARPGMTFKQVAKAVAIPVIYSAGMFGLHQYGKYKGRKREAAKAAKKAKKKRQARSQRKAAA